MPCFPRRKISITILALLIFTATTVVVFCDTKTDCGVAQTAFGMCVPYVMGEERELLSHQCCAAVKSVEELSPTPKARRGICNCLRELMGQVGRIDSRRASGLAERCGVRTNVIPTGLHFHCFGIA